MRIYSLYWRPVEHCGEMETFFTNCIYKYLRTILCLQICELSTCSCLSRRFTASSSPPVSALPCLWVVSYIPNIRAWEEDRSWRIQPAGLPSSPSSTQILQLTRFFKKFPSTYCIPSALLEIKGPAEGSVSVQHPKSTFTARVNHIHLQQNLPTVRGLCHTGSISHTSSTTFSYWEDLIWDWAIFQQEDGKTHIISLRP